VRAEKKECTGPSKKPSGPLIDSEWKKGVELHKKRSLIVFECGEKRVLRGGTLVTWEKKIIRGGDPGT